MPRLSLRERRLQKLEQEKRRQAREAEVALALKNGCPCCGAPIRRNLALTGWWQCSQFGAVGFRADPDKPACSWQTFTA